MLYINFYKTIKRWVPCGDMDRSLACTHTCLIAKGVFKGGGGSGGSNPPQKEKEKKGMLGGGGGYLLTYFWG